MSVFQVTYEHLESRVSWNMWVVQWTLCKMILRTKCEMYNVIFSTNTVTPILVSIQDPHGILWLDGASSSAALCPSKRDPACCRLLPFLLHSSPILIFCLRVFLQIYIVKENSIPAPSEVFHCLDSNTLCSSLPSRRLGES